MLPAVDKRSFVGFSPAQHRRRVSLPTTPPETPLDGYFGPDSREPVPQASDDSVFLPTPPQTPTRVPLEKDRLPPPSSHRSRTSYAYAHHRRTSTATLLRLAVARQGIVLTPSKALTLFLIVFSATWLAWFLPGPLSIIRPHGSSSSSSTAPYSHPSSPVYPHNNLPHPSNMGDAKQQAKAWSEAFAYRIPPQQHVVPASEGASPSATSATGDLLRAHPELLANRGRPARRRPLRLQKDVAVDELVEPLPPRARPADDESFDEASRSPRAPLQRQPGRTNRMKKVAVAKGQNARVGKHAPADSSAQQAAARAEQERVIREESSTGRRKLRNPKGVVAAADAAGNEEAALKVARSAGGKKHGLAEKRVKKAANEEEKRAALADEAVAPAASPAGVDEDWTGTDDADEGDE
ncbi:hypothetical protein JCM10213_005220 [Rhodosporidiobolus nylandii]